MKEQIGIINPYEKMTDYSQAFSIAKDLYERYDQEIRLSEPIPIDEEAKFGPEKAILKFLDKVPGEILSRYQGHGITRGDDVKRLASLIHICSTNLIKGDYGSMGGGAYSAYKHGPAIVLSKIDLPLYAPSERNPNHIRNEDGDFIETNIGAIILAPKWYPIAEELSQMFPAVTFIKANQIPEYFNKNI